MRVSQIIPSEEHGEGAWVYAEDFDPQEIECRKMTRGILYELVGDAYSSGTFQPHTIDVFRSADGRYWTNNEWED